MNGQEKRSKRQIIIHKSVATGEKPRCSEMVYSSRNNSGTRRATFVKIKQLKERNVIWWP